MAKIGRKYKIKKIAITGGIASGKSTVCHLFEKRGAYVVSADAIVHQLLDPTQTLGKAVIALLGTDIVVGKKLSRERIAQKVFYSPSLLQELEKLIHPEVQKVIENRYEIVSQTNIPFFIAEVPLLYEARLESFYDFVILILCDEKESKHRFAKGENEFLRRNQRLLPIEEKIKKADLILENNGSLKDLDQTIQFIYNDLKEKI